MSEQQAASAGEATFCRYTAAEARQLRDTVQTIYARSYVEAIASGDPSAPLTSWSLTRVATPSDRPGDGRSPSTAGGGRGCSLNPSRISLMRTAVAHSPFLKSWCLRSGPGKASRTRYMITSCRAAQNHGRAFSWNRKIPGPTVRICSGAGAKLHNYTPAGMMHQHSMYLS
jgi:hypothetical protein